MSEAKIADPVSERLAQLREAKAKREIARQKALRDNELQLLELEAKYESELGPRGEEFEIVDASDIGAGIVVVKLGESVLWTRYTAGKMSEADTLDFVTPQIVFPERERFLALANRRGHLATRCANAIASLHGMKVQAETGKF